MTKLNKVQKKDMLEELKKQEALMDMDVLNSKDNDQRRQDHFQKTILAIQSIVSRKLYKAVAPSLEIYFRDVWKISRAQVYRFLDCATVLNTLEGFQDRPSKERLCRSLKRHGKSPTNIRNLWTLVKIRASDREITSTLIGKCWEEIVASGKEVMEDPIPKKKECKPRKSKINFSLDSSTLVIPSSNQNAISNKTLKNHSQIKGNLVSNINTSFSSPSIITVNNTTTVLPAQKDKINTTSSLGTPLMDTNIYQYNKNIENITLPTPTTTQEQQIPEPIYASNDEKNQKMLLQSLPTPTMSSSKTLYNDDNQTSINATNSVNSTLSSEINTTSNIKYEPKQNEKKITSSYPSPTASHVITQQVNQYPTTDPASQYIVKQSVSPISVQKVNFPIGSLMVNPSPSTTPVVDSAIIDSLPQANQQIILNDLNANHGVGLSLSGFSHTTIQGQDPNNNIHVLNQSYIPMQQGDSTAQQAASYQIITNPNCILSPTLQSQPAQGLSIQSTFGSIPSYPINQPQTPQSLLMNNTANGIIDSNNMIYQSTTPKGVIFQSLSNQLAMQPSSIVYTVPPTPDQSIMLSPPSQSQVNYFNIAP